MNNDWELYDENNPDHNNTKLYEVMEYEKTLDVESVATVEEDMKKRDFVNSTVYFNLKTETLIDPSGMAIRDCQENRLRFMGKPKDRIQEDSARVFRGYKMIGRGWKPETKTLKAMRENFDFAITNTNSTRIMKEIESIVNL